MSERMKLSIAQSVDEFAAILESLKKARYARKKVAKLTPRSRQTLSNAEREEILARTAGTCHICGELIEGDWEADHVSAHSGGGAHVLDNYLPAHRLCNNYRWDYRGEEYLHILKLGIWLRTQIEKKTGVGRYAAESYLAHEVRRAKRCAGVDTSDGEMEPRMEREGMPTEP
jgi:5-methylcytosine-specific restriction endonuclease McrA